MLAKGFDPKSLDRGQWIRTAKKVEVMKRYYDQISEFISMDILIGVLFLMIAIIFAVMGAPSFLKLYYLKELNSTGINLDE